MAIFFWLDLREFLAKVPPQAAAVTDGPPIVLSQRSDPREEALLHQIVNAAGVSLIPAQECYPLARCPD